MPKLFKLFAVLFSLVWCFTLNAQQYETDPNAGPINYDPPIEAMWDLLLEFDAAVLSGAAGNAGAEWDGTSFYTTRWASNLIHEYSADGTTLIREFSIPGVTGLRDLAYDGTYFYGGASASTIYQMDFTTNTLIGTIPTTETVRHISYDSDMDAFWVGNWSTDIVLIDRTGSELARIPADPLVTSNYGSCYDNVSPGGPYLWIFSQGGGAGSPQNINQLQLPGGAVTGVAHDVLLDITGAGGSQSIAGGLFSMTDYTTGFFTIGGLLQGNPIGDMIFVYEIEPTGGVAMDKLLLTEFVVTPTAAEFIEIYNPNASPVDLTNYFVSDVAFDGGPEYYYHIVWGLYEAGFGDFMAKFPDGATIGAGEHQIIALNGDADFFTTYAVNPTYEIDQAEFQSGIPDGIPDMMETHPGSIYGADSTHNPGLTNGDEMIMLFYWDGMSDLVSDVDYVLYNDESPIPNNEAVDKTGITIDGPDPGTTGSTYLNDTPIANQLSALNNSAGFSTQRFDYTEGLQVMSGGNGVTGSDETSEDLNNTWIVDIPTPFQPIPVELTSFTARAADGVVNLSWTTATELNNQGFEIQRGTDGTYRPIGFVNGFGTTTDIHNYSFTDTDVQTGTYYYRLKQVDYNGEYAYSDVVQVDVEAPAVFALEQNYPNPFNPGTKITFNLAVDSKVSLKVFDVLGQEVTKLIGTNMTAGVHEVNFNAVGLNSGVYFYRIDATGVDGTNFTSVKKMILTK